MYKLKLIFIVLAIPVVLCSCAEGTGINAPGSAPPRVRTASSHPLRVSPDPITVGNLAAGQATLRTLDVENPGERQLVVAAVHTSCPCVNITNLPAEVGPRRSVRLQLQIDTRVEPDFRGNLAVEVVGQASDGTPLFRAEVRFSVTRGD